MPVVSMDYMYMNNNEQNKPIIVVRERFSGGIWAFVANNKGASDTHIVRKVAEVIVSLGEPKVILKTDQEPAIQELREAIRNKVWELTSRCVHEKMEYQLWDVVL